MGNHEFDQKSRFYFYISDFGSFYPFDIDNFEDFQYWIKPQNKARMEFFL